MKYNLITILGPTASGKTKLAVQLAAYLNAEIISADSRQVYRGMDIGTGKDLDEYVWNGQKIPYHLIDIVDAGHSYHIYQFQQDFEKAFNDIISRGKIAILCGGSGLYLEAVLKGFQFTAVPIDLPFRESLEDSTSDELLALFEAVPNQYSATADISTRKRLIRAIEINRYLEANPDFQLPSKIVPVSIIFGLNPPVESRRQNITKRLHQRLAEGMVTEVQNLIEAGVPSEKLIYYGLEYKFITEYLSGNILYEIMVERLNVAIHQFAKRQMTYFRKMERDGLIINWLDNEPFTKLVAML